MARLIVGIARSALAESGTSTDGEHAFVLGLGEGRTIELTPQHLESNETSWYWADVDDDPADLLEALAAHPGVTSSYMQAPESTP